VRMTEESEEKKFGRMRHPPNRAVAGLAFRSLGEDAATMQLGRAVGRPSQRVAELKIDKPFDPNE
jgi:hypothetical protein